MQPSHLPDESTQFTWPTVQPGHNTGRASARLTSPASRTWPRLTRSPSFRGDRKDTFISTLAHELRQPLSVLRTTVDLVRLAPAAAVASATAEVMARQIERMSRLVEDVIEQTRWARRKLELRKQRLDVRGVVEDALSDVQSAAMTRGHELVAAEMPEPLWVYGDALRLQQVLSNLLHNAVKFSDAAGRITVTVAREGASVTVRVADTGRGIEPGALTSIFDLFSQVRPAEGEGLGIGLSIVREIVTLHHGRIEARSEGLGRGSEFIVTLPLA